MFVLEQDVDASILLWTRCGCFNTTVNKMWVLLYYCKQDVGASILL